MMGKRDRQHGAARGVPAPQAEEQGVQIIPKQITYPIVDVGVHNSEGGRILTVTTPLGEQYVFPMTIEAAEKIGNALAAPSVVVPQAGALAIPG